MSKLSQYTHTQMHVHTHNGRHSSTHLSFHFTAMFLSAVSPAGKKGIMFLNEVAIGKQHCIYSDNPNLTTPPKGYDSVLACGTQEPG